MAWEKETCDIEKYLNNAELDREAFFEKAYYNRNFDIWEALALLCKKNIDSLKQKSKETIDAGS